MLAIRNIAAAMMLTTAFVAFGPTLDSRPSLSAPQAEAGKLWNKIKKAAKKVGGGVKKAAKKVGGGVKKVAKKTGGKVVDGAKKVGGGAKKVAKATGKKVIGAAKKALGAAKKVGQTAKRVGKKIRKGASELVSRGVPPEKLARAN